jgi:hypothetical protein
MTATANNTSEIIALCLLVDCDGVAPYIACREDSDEPQLYDVDYDAMYDIQDYEARGLKCRIIPILRHPNRRGAPLTRRGTDIPDGFTLVTVNEPSRPRRGAPSTMHGRDFVPGVKCRDGGF